MRQDWTSDNFMRRLEHIMMRESKTIVTSESDQIGEGFGEEIFFFEKYFFHFQLKNYLSSWGIIIGEYLNSVKTTWWREKREDKDNKKRSKTVHMSSSSECVGFHPSSFRLVSRRIHAFLAPTPLLPRVRRIEPTASRFAFCSQAHSSTIMNWGAEKFWSIQTVMF